MGEKLIKCSKCGNYFWGYIKTVCPKCDGKRPPIKDQGSPEYNEYVGKYNYNGLR